MTVFDASTGEKVTTPHSFKTFKIEKGSAVDRPAQEPAVVVMLMKRRDEDSADAAAGGRKIPKELKAVAEKMQTPALTSATDGHAHLIDLHDPAGNTSYEYAHGGEYGNGHSHPFVTVDGVVRIGEAAGHTHEIEAVASKSAGDSTTTGDPMDPNKTTDGDKSAERIATLETELATAKALASMSDEEKAYHATLEGAEADEFLKADAEKRTAAVTAAKAADRVVYTSKQDGTVYRESDDPRLIAFAKREDAREAELKAEKAKAEAVAYKARAKADLSHLTGDEDTHVAILKAVDTIEDEGLREKALATLKANDAGVSKSFERSGSNGASSDGEGGDAEAKLDALAQKHADENGVTFEKAYVVVSKTAEGRRLRREAMANTPAGAPA